MTSGHWVAPPSRHHCDRPGWEEVKSKREYEMHYWKCEDCQRTWVLQWWFRRLAVTNPRFEWDASVRWEEVRVSEGIELL